VKRIWLFLVVAILAGGLVACYAHDKPPEPCVNIENCGNPGDLPPINDDSPINLAGATRHDGGLDR
jgi:hypothetical protein